MVKLNIYVSPPGDHSARIPAMYIFRVEGLNDGCDSWMATKGNYSKEVFCGLSAYVGASKVRQRLTELDIIPPQIEVVSDIKPILRMSGFKQISFDQLEGIVFAMGDEFVINTQSRVLRMNLL